MFLSDSAVAQIVRWPPVPLCGRPGTFINVTTDNPEVLVLRGVGGHCSVDPAPNPGSGSNILSGVTAVGGQQWTAGVYDTGGSNLPLIEHR